MWSKFKDYLKIVGVITIIGYIAYGFYDYKSWSAFNNILVLLFDEIIKKFSHIITWIKAQFK